FVSLLSPILVYSAEQCNFYRIDGWEGGSVTSWYPSLAEACSATIGRSVNSYGNIHTVVGAKVINDRCNVAHSVKYTNGTTESPGIYSRREHYFKTDNCPTPPECWHPDYKIVQQSV